ncbi:TatD family hydrolase [Oculatella sp. LEGE 06141]|uniref:TatD family hydrolase n=1 Tax=Oculatella sp. LEGE 06141 TaxID=1828648 RepID=UPI00187E8400|nr:TatD family hydrolase [Oculatella sp. LEGE 06141]MBE9179196.1 TatD family hydrolase [Oculatella sp. LEGE 06141]
MQLIDTHVHINFDSFQADLEDVAQNWRDAGVVHLVHSCVEPSEFERTQALADRFPELSFAVGLHPLDVEKWTADSAAQILSFAMSDARVVAIGEIGLDFYKAENQDQQESVFLAQLAIARQLDRPVIIHCRDAAARMAELMRSFWANHGAVQAVMHCWSGTPEETQWFLDLGCYISFSGIVTFKNAKQVQESARGVPDDRLLIETDCPFLAPVPKRGERRNQPAYVRYVAEQLAQLRQVPLESIAAQTTANACRLFGLTLPEAGRLTLDDLTLEGQPALVTPS